MHQCSSCGKKYSRKYCLTRHQKTACRNTQKVATSKNESDKKLSVPHTKKEQEQFAQGTTERQPIEKKTWEQALSDSDTESSSDDDSDSESLPDDSEKVKALFRQLYKELHHNIKRYRKLILLSSRLWQMGCLTYEEYSELVKNIQKKIGML